MEVSRILQPLNDAQRESVCAPDRTLLVLAGAGSGKTRVLVHRMAWQLQVDGVSPHGILAVTFTNKAANEMRARIERLINVPARGMWIGTFHGLANRLLRAHWHEAGLVQEFQILDAQDQYRVIRRVLKSMDLDESAWPPRQQQWFINSSKDEGLRARHIEHRDEPVLRRKIAIYQAYEDLCARAGLVDFAELLLRAHELWLRNPDILEHYRNRFRRILVDEFQDTNTIQYAWLRVLAGDQGNITVVGDDDQSIYGWRGARIENLRRFREDYPETRTLRLEQNYRSTAVILNAANALIARNLGRWGKKLWTAGDHGEPIHLYSALNEQDEAHYVVQHITGLVEQAVARSDIAILYRSNAQSRVFEERLIQAGIPYRVYGGLRFFERAEIKDALAYLRLCCHRDDDASFERVVNHPPRGIGERTLDTLREHARLHRVSMWVAARAVSAARAAGPRACNALSAFLKLIEDMSVDIDGLRLDEQIDQMIRTSGLASHFSGEKGEKGLSRLENLQELVNAAREYDPDAEDSEQSLASFLSHAALEAGDEQAGDREECVQLMTLHSAKGLEFDVVFLCGMEEGLFPHQLSIGEAGRLEEERRLCYVGITRARRRLFMTWAEHRRMHGTDSYRTMSRFLRELPAELLEEARPRVQLARPACAAASFPSESGESSCGLRLGQQVRHPQFGDGVVLNCEGEGARARVQVNFEDAGTKWLMVACAGLEAISA
jgi:DNA helicase-2/ATP-dependent DNA helicase PcrA